MCKETDNELKKGKSLALELVKHMRRMNAANCAISVKFEGLSYVVKIRQI